jgi:hypothetical protein
VARRPAVAKFCPLADLVCQLTIKALHNAWQFLSDCYWQSGHSPAAISLKAVCALATSSMARQLPSIDSPRPPYSLGVLVPNSPIALASGGER